MNKKFRQISLMGLLVFGFGAYLVQDFYPWLLWLLFPLEVLCVFVDWLLQQQQLNQQKAVKLGKSRWTLWQMMGYVLVGLLFLFLGIRDSLQDSQSFYAQLNAQVPAGSLFLVGGYFKYFPYFVWVDGKRMHFGYNIGKNTWQLNHLVQVRMKDTFLSLEDTHSTMEVDLSLLSPAERQRLRAFMSKRLGKRMKE
ncbi:MAG: hypothetical protein R6U66_00955 [Bacteroidales bacterium]